MRERWLIGGLFGAGLAALTALALGPGLIGHASAAVEDGPGPNLVLDIGGGVEGRVVIDLLPDVAPQHVERIVTLAGEGAYDGVVFHRVIERFMAQTGDVQHGRRGDTARAGSGKSARPDLPAEFSDRPFRRGTVGMARSASPDSANSQFFVMFDDAPHLDGQYTVVGQVIVGMEIVDRIRKGPASQNGAVRDPDWIARATVEP